MKLEQIYELSIELGIKSDLRGAQAPRRQMQQARNKYEKLSSREKEDFDTELLINPYPDSRLAFGDLDKEVKTALAGIDMETAEVLLADRLGNIDLIIAHHPEGRSIAELGEQMHLQAEVLGKYGVPINIAQGVMRERISEVKRKIHSRNNQQVIDAARLLNIPYMVAHTVCDNQSAFFIEDAVKKAKPVYVSDVIEVLRNIPEYKQAAKLGAGPMIFSGSPDNYCGKVVVTEFTGGTEGSKMMYERMSHSGIGTIISMHISEESRKEAERNHINVVVAGHISSDSLGMNLFLDELEKKGVKIIPASGLIRVSRNKARKARR